MTKRALKIIEENPIAITQLNGSHNASITTLTVDSTTGFKTAGHLSIGREEIDYTGTTATTFTGCTRGAKLSVAATHADNARVVQTGTWTQEEIRAFLNQGQLEFVKKTLCLETDATENSVSGTQQYTLPTNYFKLKQPGGVFWNTGSNQSELDFVEIARSNRLANTVTGTPEYFWLWRNELWLYPIPGTTANNMIQIFYVKKPATMTVDGDTPDIDDAYHEALVFFAASRCLMVDNAPAWKTFWNLWLDQVADAAYDVMNETEGPSNTINVYNEVV